MKFIILAALVLTTSAFAYHGPTVGNDPVKEEVASEDTRDPASTVYTEETHPEE